MQLPTNALTHKTYNGINILALWVAAQQAGFVSPLWSTYKQWSSLGAQVRKGERATLIVFFKQYDATPDPNDTEDNGKRRVARASFVFNASQVDGFNAAVPSPTLPLGPIDRIHAAESFIGATKALITHGGDRAVYMPSRDVIQMPDESLFIGSTTMDRHEAYYGTLLHELVHWSGAKHRLDRTLSGRFGTAAYAAEELVAEIGSAFLCADLGITADLRADHAQYVAEWLTLLKSDSRAIFSAAARASEAANYLRAFSTTAKHDAPVEPAEPIDA